MIEIETAATPASMRRTNQRTILGLLFRLGAASRADLAKAAGLSRPTVGIIVNELLEMGLLQETALPPASSPARKKKNESAQIFPVPLGRPGQLVQLDHKQPRFLGIQLGVLETSAALLPVSATREDHWDLAFPTTASPESWLANLSRALDDLHRKPIWGVIMSVPGIVDEAVGKVLFSPNLHWTERIDLPGLIQKVWPVPVLLVQEIRALALGHLAMEPDGTDFLLVDFGQGVGGAVVLGGTLYSNTLPLSGELGHTPVPGNTRRCGCGGTGCVETLISRRGLLETFAINHPDQAPAWPSLTASLARTGMTPWLATSLDHMAVVIAEAMNVLGVRRVIFTGSLTELPAFVLDYLTAGVQQGVMWARFGQVICQNAPRRRTAGLIGAGIDRLLFPSSGREPKTALSSPRSTPSALTSAFA